VIDWREYVRARLPALPIRAEREREIVDELALQLEAAYQFEIAAGSTEDAAVVRAAAEVPDWRALAQTLARIETGARPAPGAVKNARHGTTETSASLTGRGASSMFSGTLQDFRLALRNLARTPGYAALAIGTLALGLGLGAAAFSLVDGVLIRPLPFADADRLVLVTATVPPEGRQTPELTLPDAIDLSRAEAFSGFAAILPYAGTTTLTDPPSRLEGFEVSPALFSTLGVSPPLGRPLTPADGDPSSPPVAVIGYGLWQRLGAPADIIGRVLPLDEVPHTIVGVAPRGLRIDLLPLPADVFVPIRSDHRLASSRGLRAFRGIARLAPGASIESANTAVATIGGRLAREFQDTNAGRTFSVHPLQEAIVGPVRAQIVLVSGLIALVILVAAVNLAGLVLTRTAGRLREVAVRLALGAARWRIVRESIAEGLVISGTGALVGAAIGRAALDALRAAPGHALPRLAEVSVDGRTFAALAAMAAVIACAVGLMPLLLMRQLTATAALRTGHETAARPALRLRAGLIVGQTSFAFVLLASATLLALSLRSVLGRPLGFETDQVVTMRVSVPGSRYPSRETTGRFYAELLDRLREEPGVRAAGFVSVLPLAGNTGSTLTVQGREEQPLPMRPTVGWHWASPGYFAAMGVPLIRGRDFTADDVARSPHVTVINETLARLHFPGEDPIGKRVYFGGYGPGGPPEWHDVIGIVGDVRHRQLDADPDARAYDLFGQHWGRTVSLAIRTGDGTMQAAGRVRRLLAERDPHLAVFAVRTMADVVGAAVAARRLLVWLVTFFAGVGLIVALIGLYGTLSYIVAQSTREVGVRLALGATAGELYRLVVGRGLRMVAGGLVVGLAGVIALGRVIDPQLVGRRATDVPALALATAALLLAGIAACLIPAARAVRVNPVEALRSE
jgi:putative ABC transport system permease protein